MTKFCPVVHCTFSGERKEPLIRNEGAAAFETAIPLRELKQALAPSSLQFLKHGQTYAGAKSSFGIGKTPISRLLITQSDHLIRETYWTQELSRLSLMLVICLLCTDECIESNASQCAAR